MLYIDLIIYIKSLNTETKIIILEVLAIILNITYGLYINKATKL